MKKFITRDDSKTESKQTVVPKYRNGTSGVGFGKGLESTANILGGISQLGAMAANTAGNEDTTKYMGALNGFAGAASTIGGSFANRKSSPVAEANQYRMGSKGIHIKPENKGKFNATKKATGKTTEELTHSSNPITKKRAIFAQNASRWKH